MEEKYLASQNVIGSTVIKSKDDSLLLMYSSFDGKHFIKSTDNFRTVSEKWIVNLDSITANANMIRLNDGNLILIIRKLSEREDVSKVLGASFYTAISDDEGKTFAITGKINKEEKCYYLMNNRIMRTKSGRILLPMCYVDDSALSPEKNEKIGFAGCFFSDDDGKTWSEGNWLLGESVDQLAEPMIAQGNNGVLHMYMRTGCGYLYHSISEDDGTTWSREEASSLRSPCAPFCFNYDEKSGLFFAVWDNSFPGPVHQYPRCPICIAKSTDACNWEMICELDNDPMKSYGYPMLYFTENEIIVTYYESENREFNPKNHKLKAKLISREELGI